VKCEDLNSRLAEFDRLDRLAVDVKGLEDAEKEANQRPEQDGKKDYLAEQRQERQQKETMRRVDRQLLDCTSQRIDLDALLGLDADRSEEGPLLVDEVPLYQDVRLQKVVTVKDIQSVIQSIQKRDPCSPTASQEQLQELLAPLRTQVGDLRAKREAISTRLFLQQELLQQQQRATKAIAEKYEQVESQREEPGDDDVGDDGPVEVGHEQETPHLSEVGGLPSPGGEAPGWIGLPPLPAAALLSQRPERGDSGGSARSNSSREREAGGTGSRRVVSVFRTPAALSPLSHRSQGGRGGFNVAQAMGRRAAGSDSAAAAVGALLLMRERQVRNILHST